MRSWFIPVGVLSSSAPSSDCYQNIPTMMNYALALQARINPPFCESVMSRDFITAMGGGAEKETKMSRNGIKVWIMTPKYKQHLQSMYKALELILEDSECLDVCLHPWPSCTASASSIIKQTKLLLLSVQDFHGMNILIPLMRASYV